MINLKVKPLSVNEVWQGKRFKTASYKMYEQQVLYMLPARVEIPDGKLSVSYTFGLSSKNADADNPVKPFQDIICKKYGINDKRIYEYHICKVDVKKGEEFISFEIKGIEE